LGKHCHDEGCPGVYEDDDTCSHCGKTDPDTLPYVHLRAELPNPGINLSGEMLTAIANVQVHLDDGGVVVDVRGNDTSGYAIASTHKLYSDMRLSLRRWDAGGDVSARELLTQFKNGNRQDVITTLLEAHPCVTALLLTTGMLEKTLTQEDCNIITNMLIDAKTEENE
jgi:hypothetical protein